MVLDRREGPKDRDLFQWHSETCRRDEKEENLLQCRFIHPIKNFYLMKWYMVTTSAINLGLDYIMDK